jgi:hypothetical protein
MPGGGGGRGTTGGRCPGKGRGGVRMEGGVPAAAAAREWGRCPGGDGSKDCGEEPWRRRVEEWRDLSVPPAVAWREMESRLSRRRRRRQRGMEYGVVVAE